MSVFMQKMHIGNELLHPVISKRFPNWLGLSEDSEQYNFTSLVGVININKWDTGLKIAKV